ncbi:hypothetical protein GGF42_009089 [Coemansia sp. RSA 2424]|nr:hypothetical protein GGF42_009089 [Coemansia sp. RSA 2424]
MESGKKPTTTDDDRLYNRLVFHPLRPNDHISTLHCVYTVVAARWIAVCWCDERGEYVEHAVFADTATSGSEISPAAAARIWRGCIRYQKLVGGQLRVVLAEWQGMGCAQACAWRDYVTAWQQLHHHHRHHLAAVHLCLVNIGVNPRDGLCLTHNNHPPPPPSATADDYESGGGGGACLEPEFSARLQCSLVLHGHHPRLERFSSAHATTEWVSSSLLSSRRLVATGYLVAAQKPVRGAYPDTATTVPCFCVQLLDVLNDLLPSEDIIASDAASAATSSSSRCKLELMTTRSILKQYFQLAWLRHAERDSPPATTPTTIGGGAKLHASALQWPVHFLPLPIGIIEDIRSVLEHLI